MSDVLQFKTDTEKLIVRAKEAAEKGDFGHAIKLVRRYIDITSDAKAELFWVELLCVAGEFGFAKRHCFKLLKQRFPAVRVAAYLGMCLLAERDFQALDYYGEAIKLADKSEFQNLGNSQGNGIEVEISEFAQGSEEDLFLVKPKSREFYHYALERATELLENGDFKSSIEIIDKIPSNNEFYLSAQTLKALSYTALGDYDSASALVERLLKSSPDDPELLSTYYHILTMQGRQIEADAVADKLKDAQIGNDLASLAKGLHIFASIKNHARVLEISDKTLKIRPFSSTAMLLKGIAMYNLGQKSAACDFIKNITLLYPEFEVAADILEFAKTSPVEINYALRQPLPLYLKRSTAAESLLIADDDELLKALNYKRDIVRWGIVNMTSEKADKLIDKLTNLRNRAALAFLSDLLIDDVSVDVKHEIVFNLIRKMLLNTIDIEVENIYKTVKLASFNFQKMPYILAEAFAIAEADEIIICLSPKSVIEGLAATAKKLENCDECEFKTLRSPRTMAAVFCYLEERKNEDFDLKNFLADFKVNARLFNKYLDIVKSKMEVK